MIGYLASQTRSPSPPANNFTMLSIKNTMLETTILETAILETAMLETAMLKIKKRFSQKVILERLSCLM